MAHPTPTSTEPLSNRVVAARLAIAFALNLIPSLITAALAGLLIAAVHPGSALLPGVLRGSFVAAFGAYGFLATAYVA
jgi:hypothetical protein